MASGVRTVTKEKLALSKAPAAELASAALEASADAGLEPGAAAFVIVAVPAHDIADAEDTARQAFVDVRTSA